MNALEDRRPVAATTTSSDNPSVIGEDLMHLLLEHPDIELASIRLIPNNDGTVGIAGRIGQLAAAAIECPQCHQPIGRPHTEFCTLAPDRVWPEGHHLVHSEAFIDQDDPRSHPHPPLHVMSCDECGADLDVRLHFISCSQSTPDSP